MFTDQIKIKSFQVFFYFSLIGKNNEFLNESWPCLLNIQYILSTMQKEHYLKPFLLIQNVVFKTDVKTTAYKI